MYIFSIFSMLFVNSRTTHYFYTYYPKTRVHVYYVHSLLNETSNHSSLDVLDILTFSPFSLLDAP